MNQVGDEAARPDATEGATEGAKEGAREGAAVGAAETARVRAGFASQSFMRTLGAEVVEAGRGWTRVMFRRREGLGQQHGYLHAGVATSIADSACGYAAMSMVPEGGDVLTIEFKANFLRPASGDLFEASGKVIKPGRQIMVCEGEVWESEPQRRLIMTMSATMFVLQSEKA